MYLLYSTSQWLFFCLADDCDQIKTHFCLKPKTDTSIFTSLKNVHESTRTIDFYPAQNECKRGLKDKGESPRSSPSLLSIYWHNSLPNGTPIIQLIDGWLILLYPARFEMRHEALRRKRDTGIVWYVQGSIQKLIEACLSLQLFQILSNNSDSALQSNKKPTWEGDQYFSAVRY